MFLGDQLLQGPTGTEADEDLFIFRDANGTKPRIFLPMGAMLDCFLADVAQGTATRCHDDPRLQVIGYSTPTRVVSAVRPFLKKAIAERGLNVKLNRPEGRYAFFQRN